MSIQGDIETRLTAVLEGAISGIAVTKGSATVPQLEGDARAATVRLVSGTSERLEFGQNRVTEDVAVSLFWRSTIARDTRLTEYEAFADAMLAEQYLGGSITGVEDSYISATLWNEAADAGYIVMVSTVTVVRVE